MTGRERVHRAIRFQDPDRVPLAHSYSLEHEQKFDDELLGLLEEFPSDFAQPIRHVFPQPGRLEGDRFVDLWGCVWRAPDGKRTGEILEHSLSDWRRLSDFLPPEVEEYFSCDASPRPAVEGDPAKYRLGYGGSVLQRMITLRGYDNLMEDFVERREELVWLRDLIVQFNLQYIDRLAFADLDGIEIADDWGRQDRMIADAEVFRKLFLPAYQQIFERITSYEMHVHFRSRGAVGPILSDLADSGVDVFDVQLDLIGVEPLAEEFAGRVCFRADVGSEQILQWKLDGVRKRLLELIQVFAPCHGGLIGCVEISSDVPSEDVRAVLEEFYTHGRYPVEHTRNGKSP